MQAATQEPGAAGLVALGLAAGHERHVAGDGLQRVTVRGVPLHGNARLRRRSGS